MEKTQNLMSNISNVSNNKKKSNVGRNAAIIGGAAVLGGGASAAAAASYLSAEEIMPELEEDVEVDYIDAEPEEVEVEQEVPVAYASPSVHHSAVVEPQPVDPIIDDADEVALNVDEEDPFDAVVIDDELADGMPESFDIEFIETGDDEFETNMIEIEDDNLLAFDDDFEEIDINFEEDTTIEDIIADDIVDTGLDADIF